MDDQLRTNVPGVWAIGEVNGCGDFTHTAYNDCEIVAANFFDDDPRRVTDRIPYYGLFIDPLLGRVGMTEREARASGRKALIGKRLMTHIGQAREFGETRGFMKVIVDAKNRGDPRRIATGPEWGRGSPHTAGCRVRRAALYGYFPRRAYPSHGL